jgi:hypothetical protein
VPDEPAKEVLAARPDRAVEIPPGRYQIRAGSPGFALGTNVSSSAAASVPDAAPDTVRLSLVAGGSIRIEPSAVPSPGAVQLVSFSTGKTDVFFVDRERELPVPAGKVVAVGLIRPGKFLGITKILPIQPGKQTVVQGFDRPAPTRSNVLVRGDYTGGSAQDPKDVSIALVSGAARFESAAATNAADGSHYSVFYGIAQGPERIDVSSKRWRANLLDVAVSEPFVFKGDLVLVPKPSLTVRPIGVGRSEKWTVKVYSCKETDFGPGSAAWPPLEKCTSDSVMEGSGSEVVVHNLDPKWYFVLVERSGKKAGKQVDLRSGQDRQEDFDFQGRRIYGVVRQGNQGVAATLTFKNSDSGDTADDVTSTSDGSYEQFLSEAGKYRVEIRTPTMAEGQTAVFEITVGDEESIQKDFTIPGGRVTVAVTNERTRQAIRDASVEFLLAGANEERKTDETGVATLPPLPRGTLRLVVTADGYERKSQTFEVVETKAQRLNIQLKPLEEGQTFRVLLPDGSPAASATVLWSLDGNGGFSYRQRCDSAGTCRFNQRPSDEETLFVVDKQAGLTIVTAGAAFRDSEVRLSPAGGPLTVNVRRVGPSSTGGLSAKVFVGGVMVGTFALEMIANLVGENSQLYAYPGAAQPIVIPGLPAGTPLGLVISPAAGGLTPSPARQTPVQLPLSVPLDIVVP